MALTNKLTAIADSIREKLGTTDAMTLDEMPNKISSIKTGPSIQESKTIEITSNGTTEVIPDDGYGGIKKVDISVAVPIPALEEERNWSITQNGTEVIEPYGGYDGIKKVVVTTNVEAQNPNANYALNWQEKTDVPSYVGAALQAFSGGASNGLENIAKNTSEAIIVVAELSSGLAVPFVWWGDLISSFFLQYSGTPSTVVYHSPAGDIQIPTLEGAGPTIEITPAILTDLKEKASAYILKATGGSEAQVTFTSASYTLFGASYGG